MKFSAETYAEVQKILQLRDALAKTADTAHKFGEDAAKAGEKAKWSFENMGEGARDLAIGFVGINSAASLLEKGVEGVSRVWEAHLERMRKKAEELLGKVIQLNEATGNAGEGAKSPEAQLTIKEVAESNPGGRLLGEKEASDLYANIYNGRRSTIDDATRKEALIVAAKGRAEGMSTDEAKHLSLLYADLVRGGMPNGKAAQDKAFEGATQAISDINMRSYFRSGGDPQAFDLDVAATRVFEGQKKVDSILALTEDASPEQLKEWRKHPTKYAHELAIQSLPKKQRLAKILSNPELAPTAERESVQSIAASMKDLKPSDLDAAIAERSKSLATNEPSRVAALSHLTDIVEERALEVNANAEAQKSLRLKFYESYYRIKNPNISAATGTFMVPTNMEHDYEAFEKQKNSYGLSYQDKKFYETHPNPNDPKELMLALERNTEATRQNTQSNNGGPALKNNSELQK